LEAQEFWHTICTKAFNNDNDTSDFVLFFEGCKTLNNDQLYEWKSSDSEYQTMLEQLGCNRSKSDLFTLQPDQLSYFLQAKSKIRTDWHAEKQVALKQHLKALLQQESQLPHIDQHQRLSLVRQF
ncbi:hypothetical protein BDF20DRAFT_803998, partial [Mycotypha africana]|uniref:uncharacterized protein n=1 Tax=Mycotypha africana TaxID=64632 RepID=UPI002300B25B